MSGPLRSLYSAKMQFITLQMRVRDGLQMASDRLTSTCCCAFGNYIFFHLTYSKLHFHIYEVEVSGDVHTPAFMNVMHKGCFIELLGLSSGIKRKYICLLGSIGKGTVCFCESI